MIETGPAKKIEIAFPTRKAYGKLFDVRGVGFSIIDNQGRIHQANKILRQLLGPLEGPNIILANNRLFLDILGVNSEGLPHLLSSPSIKRSDQHATVHLGEGLTRHFRYSLTRVSENRLAFELKDLAGEGRKEIHRADEARLIETGQNAFHIMHALKGSAVLLRIALARLAQHPDTATLSDTLPSLTQACERLTTIIGGSLKVGERKNVEFETIDLAQLLNEVCSLQQIAGRLKGKSTSEDIELVAGGAAPGIKGVRSQIREVLIVLIENSIDAVRVQNIAGGRIAVSVQGSETPGEVSLAVTDNGCGIPPDRLASIYKLFYTTKPEGSGIGLHYAKEVVEGVHRGAIHVASREGEGTTFTLLFPCEPQAAQAQEPLGIEEKLQQVRQAVASAAGIDPGLAEQCIDSMTREHIRDSATAEIIAQIRGQVSCLEQFLRSRRMSVSVNNFSLRTEVVLTADKGSSARLYWQSAILHELQLLGESEMISVHGTRYIERELGVCRVFEIRKKGAAKISDDLRTALEKALFDKLTPLPTLAENEAQNTFLGATYLLVKSLKTFGIVGSLIFNPSLNNGRRLVGFKVRQFPETGPQLEESVTAWYLHARPKMEGLLRSVPIELPGSGEISLIGSQLTPGFIEGSGLDDFARKIISSFDIRNALMAIFNLADGGIVVNFLASRAEALLPAIKDRFLGRNTDWQSPTK